MGTNTNAHLSYFGVRDRLCSRAITGGGRVLREARMSNFTAAAPVNGTFAGQMQPPPEPPIRDGAKPLPKECSHANTETEWKAPPGGHWEKVSCKDCGDMLDLMWFTATPTPTPPQ